jgi:hypothetical protein
VNIVKLHPTQQGLSKLTERRSLYFETVNLSLDSPHQHRFGSVSTKFSEFVFEMLLGLRGDIPDLLLALEVGDELSGCAHPPTIGEMAV